MNFVYLFDIMSDFIDPLKPYWLELLFLFGLLVFLMMLGVGETFKKAGKPAWGAWIPIYNLYLLFDIVYGHGWKFLLLFVPIYNVFLLLLLPFQLAKKYRRSILFGFFLLIFPFGAYPVLGFDDTGYVDETRKRKQQSDVSGSHDAINPQRNEKKSHEMEISNQDSLTFDKREKTSKKESSPLEKSFTEKHLNKNLQPSHDFSIKENNPIESNASFSRMNLTDSSIQSLQESFDTSLKNIKIESSSHPSDSLVLEKANQKSILEEEMSSIQSILGNGNFKDSTKVNSSVQEEKTNIKSFNDGDSSQILSSELSFLDSILSPQK